MRKKYLLLAGILMAAQVLTVVPSFAEETAAEEEVVEEVVFETEEADEVDKEAAEAEIEVVEEEEETTAEEEAEAEETEEEADETEEAEEKVRPEYDYHDYLKKLGTYEGLSVEVNPVEEITEEMIQAEISGRIDGSGIYDELEEGTVEVGDIANIDYVGKKDDVAFEGGTAEGYDLLIGSGNFIPGFEDGLIGVGVGETVDLNLTFPEEYHAPDLAGAEVVFTVTVNSIKRTPEYNDEFIEKLSEGEYKDMESYEASVKADLEVQAKEQQKVEVADALWELVYNDCEFDSVPEDVVVYDLQRTLDYQTLILTYYYGMSLEDFCSMQGITVEENEAQMRENIVASLQYEMMERAIVEAEGMEVSDEEYNEYVEKFAAQYGYDVETFVENNAEEDIWKSIMYQKSEEILLEKNNYTEK